MSDAPVKRRRRPPKRSIERLKAKIMVSVLQAKLDVTSVYGLTRVLFPEYHSKSAEMATIERTWRRYAKGAVVPEKDFKNSLSAKRAEKISPGCLRSLDSFAWEVLKDSVIEPHEILNAIHHLPQNIRSILIGPDIDPYTLEPRFREFSNEVARNVAALAGFEAIETFVLLGAYARSILSEALGNAVALTYMEQRPCLSEDPELSLHFRELFTAADQHLKIWVSTSSTMKFDVLAPWQGQMVQMSDVYHWFFST